MMNNKRISIAARALAIGMVAALLLVGTAMGEVSRTGLVGEWHFDGDAKDSSGNGNDGTIKGAAFVQGISGQALSFNGNNNYVIIQYASPINFNENTDFTLTAWIKTRISASMQSIIKRSAYGSNTFEVKMFVENQNARAHVFRQDYGTVSLTGSSSVTDDNWHLITVTYSKANGRLTLYVDGVSEATDNNVNIPGPGGSAGYNWYIGTEQDGRYSAFNGIIDEVRMYNRVLSDSEIKANYGASKAPPQPSLTLTKSLSPSTIAEGDSTTVTIRIENTGGDAKNVKITDTIPQGFTLLSGSASQEYATLKATESRTFQYTVKATGTGRFVSDLATVTYQDDKGNSYSGASNSATITVQAGTGQAPQQPAAQPKTPGFGAILAGIGIILALALRRR